MPLPPKQAQLKCSHFAHAPLPILTPRQLNKFPREEPKKRIFDSYIICKNLFSAKRVTVTISCHCVLINSWQR
jgi:hypothetical protein